jgi:hypothetical protein
VAEEVALLDDLAGSRASWSAAIIAAPGGAAGCTSGFGDAMAAPRLHQFATTAAPAARLYSICADPAASLASAVNQFAAASEHSR